METICQACGYQRKITDQTPDWECPACGKAYSKTSHGQPTTAPVKKPKPTDSDKHATGGNACANYLAEHYEIPQTYRHSIVRGVVTPILGIALLLTVNGFVLAIFLGSTIQELSRGWLIAIAAGAMLLATYITAKQIGRGVTIRADSIEIMVPLSASTRIIPAKHIIGYATDYVSGSKSSVWRFAFICRRPELPEELVYFSFGEENLKDPRLYGLFKAMQNHGNSSLTKLMSQVIRGELRLLENFSAFLLFLVNIFAVCLIYFVAIKK